MGEDATVDLRETMSARLQSLPADASVSEDVQNKLAEAGLTTLSLFASIREDGKAVREFLADVIELCPLAHMGRAERGRVRMDITRICSAHTVSKAANEVEVLINSEGASAQLPVQIGASEWTSVRRAFCLDQSDIVMSFCFCVFVP